MKRLKLDVYKLLRHAALAFLAAGMLVSCATPDKQPGAETAIPDVPAETGPAAAVSAVPAQPLTEELVYDILLAEIAGQRGQLDVSAPHYLQAALEASDPRVAERAVQVASYGKQYDIARKAAHRWVELDPDNIEARKELLKLSLHTGTLDEVIEQLDYLQQLTSSPEQAYQLSTAVLASHPDSAAALDAAEQLAARHPEDAYAHMTVCRIAVLADNLDRALSAADRAVQLRPDLIPAVILKAQILVRQDDKAAATRLLQETVSRHPDNAKLHFAYGRMLLDTEDLEAAIVQFREVVKLDPGNDEALYSLALLELETQRYALGEKHLLQLLERGQKAQSVYYYLGYAAAEQGHNKQAIEWYDKVDSGEYWSQAQLRAARILVKQGRVDDLRQRMLETQQNFPENAVELNLIEGEALYDGGQYTAAFETYHRALEANPANQDLLYARALAAEKLGQLEEAERDMRHILANDPDNVRTLNALGYTLADRTNRYDEALTYIQRAYAQKPDDPAIIDSMGWIHYRLGNLDEAQRYLQQAWELSRDGEIGAHYGEVLWMQGEQDAARKIWAEARENAPDNPILLKVINQFNP
ncbi:MAG: tetratricopeptide repeat protein [Gammaproteobacteria bacterium]